MTSVLFVNCTSNGGKNLVPGDNYGKTYSIGDNAMSDKLQMLSEAYSMQNTDELVKHYDADFLGENGVETTRRMVRINGFNKHETLCNYSCKASRRPRHKSIGMV